MRRRVAIALLVIATVGALIVGVGCGGDGGGDYRVRAMFHNAFTVIPGEDVKIAGVKVGKIESLDVQGNQAAVVLDITRAGFQDFRRDATCTIRPQSLIGERFVECTPTQPRGAGEPAAPPLARIRRGPGTGQYLLPASQTIRPIDIDLVANIMRLPYRQRLSIIINELGTGLAANGPALREAIRSASPALRETDRVLAILAEQNRVLADLAVNGDRVLAPLARDRAAVADFIDKASTTAVASAERSDDIAAGLHRLPGALRQIRPTMQRLGALAQEMTPALTSLDANATALNRFIERLGPFSRAGIPALRSLGTAADAGDHALVAARPIVGRLGALSANARPLVRNFGDLLTSFRGNGGVERLMDFLYYSASSTNGYDADGHYLRAQAIVNACLDYTATRNPSCLANFRPAATAATARAQPARAASARPSADPAAIPTDPVRTALLDYLLGD